LNNIFADYQPFIEKQKKMPQMRYLPGQEASSGLTRVAQKIAVYHNIPQKSRFTRRSFSEGGAGFT
jgi:hypothetical protein